MRLKYLHVRNLKLLAEQTFSFVDDNGEPRAWTAFLGDNGLCKTSVLQAIALASAGERMASRLLDGDANDYRNASRPGAPTVIEAEFCDPDLIVSLKLEPESYEFEGNAAAAKLDHDRSRRTAGLFVAGYGVGRRLPRKGEVPIPEDPADRLEGLFDSQHKMLGIDFFEALRDIETRSERKLVHDYVVALRDALLTKDAAGNSLLPWLTNVELRGKNGVDEMRKLLESRRLVVEMPGGPELKLPPHLLSQGYQSTFAWVADLLGHAFLDLGEPVAAKDLKGIVLLDEIDLHLHPTWQRRLVPVLRTVFPSLQFVVTTHSPLVVTGFDSDEILKFELKEGEVVARPVRGQPALQTSSELMASYFDVATAGRPDLVEKERELRGLHGLANPTSEAKVRVEQLEQELSPYVEGAAEGRMDEPEIAPLDASLDDIRELLSSVTPVPAIDDAQATEGDS